MFITKPDFSSGKFPQIVCTKFLVKVERKAHFNKKW